MTSSRFESEQYTSEAFVESAGAVLFRLASNEICVLHLLERNEYVLAKGRRNCEESRQAAALREVTEETGYHCSLLPLNMNSRVTPASETEQPGDVARFYKNICEPFSLQIRHLSKDDVKLIWWFVASVQDEKPIERNEVDNKKFEVEFYRYEKVLEILTYKMDRDVVKQAIELVTNTYNS